VRSRINLLSTFTRLYIANRVPVPPRASALQVRGGKELNGWRRNRPHRLPLSKPLKNVEFADLDSAEFRETLTGFRTVGSRPSQGRSRRRPSCSPFADAVDGVLNRKPNRAIVATLALAAQSATGRVREGMPGVPCGMGAGEALSQ